MRKPEDTLLAALLALGPVAALGATTVASAEGQDFTSFELEQLMAMEVTGVTKRVSSYARSPAAVFVLTSEDIHRSGARTLADALRLVPGLQVVRTNGHAYTVTARGFGGDKLQVLLDGRSVYTPLTSTVFWDVFDTHLEDVARIEVIRGPGATVWGANAVNGVINIITRSSSDSDGTSLFAGGGTEEKSFGGFRSGGRIGEHTTGRAYARARERDSTERADGSEVADGQSHVQAGGRIDSALGTLGSFTVMGDIYTSRLYSAEFPSGEVTDTDASGRNLGLQWTYDWKGGASTQTSLYYDGYDRVIPTIFAESRDTYDLAVQHNLAPLGDHLLTAGAGARTSSDDTGGAPLAIVFEPGSRTTETYSAFIQDEWGITNALWLIGGVKVEHNDFTGFEFQPGLRLGWALTPAHFTWASVSRAVRTPNRLDHDIGIACTGAGVPLPDCPGPGVILGIGSKDFESEKLIAYEWGFRSQFTPTLLGDIALFLNDYKDLRSTEPGLRFANGLDAQGMGGEVSVSWRPRQWIGVQAFYNYLKIDAHRDENSNDSASVNTLENGSPQQQAGLRIGVEPLSNVDVDTFVRFVDSLPAQRVPAYTEMDLRLAWHVTPLLEFALAGQNLLDASHPESGANPATRSEIPRGGFVEMMWRWK